MVRKVTHVVQGLHFDASPIVSHTGGASTNAGCSGARSNGFYPALKSRHVTNLRYKPFTSPPQVQSQDELSMENSDWE
jgi:hypothetical protein